MNTFYGITPDEMPPYGLNGESPPYERGMKVPQSRGFTPQQRFDLGHTVVEKARHPSGPDEFHELDLLMEFMRMGQGNPATKLPQPEAKARKEAPRVMGLVPRIIESSQK